MSIVVLETSSSICGIVPCLNLSAKDFKDIGNSFLTFFSGLNQLVSDAIIMFNNNISEACSLANRTGYMSSPYLRSTFHSICVKATDLVPVSVLLEEESLTSLSI
jgi:hypothetical protein